MAQWMRVGTILVGTFVMALAASGCGDDDDDDGTEADRIGVGAACAKNEDCLEGQTCLLNFKGGYCGLKDCTAHIDCPDGSRCVTHDDGVNYCFRECVDKARDCNRNRPVDIESNCVANITFVEPYSGKACVPPSGT